MADGEQQQMTTDERLEIISKQLSEIHREALRTAHAVERLVDHAEASARRETGGTF